MNERERRFCEEYLIDLSPKKAAARAGYAPSTARNAWCWIATRNPSKPQMRAEIDRMLAERALRTRVNADRVVRELASIAFEEGPEAEAGRGGAVRTQDKLRALELLGKHLGMFAGGASVERELPVIVDDAQGAPGDGAGGGGD